MKKSGKIFYGFQYMHDFDTTIGHPNRSTGRYSTAGTLLVFSKKSARDDWRKDSLISDTDGMLAGVRLGVTPSHARDLLAGLSLAEYKNFINYLKGDDEFARYGRTEAATRYAADNFLTGV